MAGRADISDPGILRTFRAGQLRFQQQMEGALDAAPTRLSKAQERLRLELAPFWKREVVKRQDAYAAARRRWLEAEADVRAGSEGRRGAIEKPSSIDERREMLKAQRRLEEAEAKLEAVRTWTTRLDVEGKDLLGKIRNLGLSLGQQCREANAQLEAMATRIDEYLAAGGGGP